MCTYGRNVAAPQIFNSRSIRNLEGIVQIICALERRKTADIQFSTGKCGFGEEIKIHKSVIFARLTVVVYVHRYGRTA